MFRLTRERTAKGKTSVEVVYGITSLTRERADAARLLGLVRRHWGIEMALAHCPPSDKLFGGGPHPGFARTGPTRSSLAWSRYP